MRFNLFHDETLHLPIPITPVFIRPKFAWLWLPIRVYLGYQWFTAGWAKLHSPAWMRSGDALAGFWRQAVYAPVGGDHGVVHYGWYHAFLQYVLTHHWAPWFAKLIAGSETAVGVLLILGAFTGLVALGGAFLNFNYLLAGSASANPVLLTLGVLLALSWPIAGCVGLDCVLLRSHRMPWAPLFHARRASQFFHRARRRLASPQHIRRLHGPHGRIRRPRRPFLAQGPG